jgi:hypothetical protein
VAIRGLAPTLRIGGVDLGGGSPGGTETRFESGLVYQAGSGYGMYSILSDHGTSYIANTIVIEDQGGGGLASGYGFPRAHNVTIVNGKGRGVSSGDRGIFRNVLCSGNTGGGFYYPGANSMNCASSDATADDAGGTGQRISQTFTFVSAANKDFHLAPTDAGARNYGADVRFDPTLPLGIDIDGEVRVAPLDIGADEVPAGGNTPPTAVIAANPTSGTAPLAVSFSGAGSSGPDGTIASCAWPLATGRTGRARPSITHIRRPEPTPRP